MYKKWRPSGRKPGQRWLTFGPAVVTGQDIPGHLMGKVMRDMPVLCWDRVRFVGDRVAAVAKSSAM